MATPKKQQKDVFETYVDGVIDEDDEVEAAKELAAKKKIGKSILRQAQSGDDLVRLLVEEAVRVAASRLKEQVAMVTAQVKAETRAMVSVDPRSLKPVRSVDVAARKTARVLDEKSADASTVDEARKPEEV